jgi:membrane-associated protease RseP (regulator of RpoE activity)
MSSSLGTLLFVVALLVTILIHEAAHFGFAKAFGIKVEEFFVGFGPRLWSVRRGETDYGVKALPLGGYVRIAGMNPYEQVPPEAYPRTFGAKPAWQRAVVIVAGPATHFLLAFVFFAIWLGVYGTISDRSPVVGSVERTLSGNRSPAVAAGLRPHDQIVGVDSIDDPTIAQLHRYTTAHVGQPITLRVRRDGRTFTVHPTPVRARVEGQSRGLIGVLLTYARRPGGFVGSFTSSARYVSDTTVLVVKSLGRVFGPSGIGRILDLVFGTAQRRPSDVTSVVGAGRLAGQAAQAGAFDVLLQLFAVFNVFIGLLNLVPLPPFDGGHLAVIAVEKIRGRKVDPTKLVPLTAAVAAFFVLFVGSLIYLDFVKPVPNLFR